MEKKKIESRGRVSDGERMKGQRSIRMKITKQKTGEKEERKGKSERRKRKRGTNKTQNCFVDLSATETGLT